MKHLLEVTLRFEVEADGEETALEVVKEQMNDLNETLSDHYVYEWTNPTIYAD